MRAQQPSGGRGGGRGEGRGITSRGRGGRGRGGGGGGVGGGGGGEGAGCVPGSAASHNTGHKCMCATPPWGAKNTVSFSHDVPGETPARKLVFGITSSGNSVSSISQPSESGRPPLGRNRTVEKGDNCSFQKKRRGNDLNRIHDLKSDLEDFDYDPEYDEGRFDDDCDERYTETRLQREDYERNMDESERIITDQHRKEFMARAFPATLPLGDDVPHQTKVATIKMCRSKADFDKIINIVDNWHPELKIRDMEKGSSSPLATSCIFNTVFPRCTFLDVPPGKCFVN